MYTLVDGKKSYDNGQLSFSMEGYDGTAPSIGSNKKWLIAVLILAIIAVAISGYLLYKNVYGQRHDEKFGYRLY